ncbi:MULTISPECIES: hypothetical protein [Pseudomonas]|uniref:hypothetical protein n=1 Tax=Pseudomonas TaxID=286 RepID=UPI001F027CB8|nr:MULTISPECIES: hypothetical protein [Pseudomonas]MCG8292055.1 hypothetical protein [Pseudomonas entomophila]
MPRVFIAGSITIKRLPPQVEARLDNIRSSGLDVLVGDAGGVDHAVQRYFHQALYPAVTVYCSGDTPRHNDGGWPLTTVLPPANAKGRAFHTAKDLAMAADCDYGLMIWDCKSPGTLGNVLELLGRQKKSVVYLKPLEQFRTITSPGDLQWLVAQMDDTARQEADRKISLSKKITRLCAPETSDDIAASLRARIEEHRLHIARHEQSIVELQTRLAALQPMDELFPD